MGDWYNNTCLGDIIEVEVEQPEGRYRWRPVTQLGRRRAYFQREDHHIEAPWDYGPVPDNLKPRWMK